MTSFPGMGQLAVGPSAPSAPGPGRIISQQPFTLLGGSWKVTCFVVCGGTMSGVTDPQSWLMSVNGSVARNSVAGLKLLFSTVTSQIRAPFGTGPTVGGKGVGVGVGAGVGVGLATGARPVGTATP